MIGNSAQDFLPVPRTWPQGHEKAGQPMRWKARCPACERELAGLRNSKRWQDGDAHERELLEAPILAVVEIVQVEADPKWLKLLSDRAREAMVRAFGERVRFPVECARHAHFTNESEARRTSTQAELVPPEMVGIRGPATEMTDEQRFGG